MRATHVITRLIVGGAQENTVSSVLGSQSRPDWRVDLISGPTTGPEGTLEPLFQSHPGLLTIVPELVRPVRPGLDWKALHALRAIFERTRPDIVHTHSGKAGVVGRWAAARARVPVVIHTIHGPSFGPWQGPGANFLYRAAERFVDRFTTHFIVVANAMTRQYLQAGIGSPDKYTRVFSGFNIEPFLHARNDPQLRRRLGLEPGDFVVGKIARLTDLKGHDDLFAAASAIVKRHPHVKFLLVGGGPHEDRFKRAAQRLNLESHFVFTGLVPPGQVPFYVGIMDMLVHLSAREGLPRALPQALAAGKPITAFDCDGAGEICLNEETGILLRPRDQAGLVEAVCRLAENPALRDEFGRRGRSLVQESFPVEKMIGAIFAVYERQLDSAGIPRPKQAA